MFPIRRRLLILALAAAAYPAVAAAEPPAKPPVDAPELAGLGPHPIGVADETIVQRRQVDPASGEPADHRLRLKIWYPAAKPGPGTLYRAAMTGASGTDVAFTVAGLATPDAAPAKGSFPLVILAHGYGNAPEALSWLGENLASKGYVVVAPAFRDPPITIRTVAAAAVPLARRPLDLVFVAAEMQRAARAHEGVLASADPSRTALIGYSMGGYGVLSAAGAPLDPGLASLTHGALAPYVAGAPEQKKIAVADLKAVVAIAPPKEVRGVNAWAAPASARSARRPSSSSAAPITSSAMIPASAPCSTARPARTAIC